MEGRQAHTQDLGSRPEEAAIKDLLLSASGRLGQSGLQTTLCATCATGEGYVRTQDPLTVAGLVQGDCRLLLKKKTGEKSGWSPEGQVRKSQVGMTVGSNPKTGTLLLKETQRS